MKKNKFSIILATYNRSEYIKDCIKSILSQTYTNYEIIVIDQSEDDKSKKIIEKINNDKIKYIKINKKGLSLSRNIGLKNSTGDYVCFMDDDAEYDKNFLLDSNKVLKENKLDGCCGIIKDKNSGEFFLNRMNKKNEEYITKCNFMDICCSASIVISKKYIDEVEGFDEEFGIGAKYPSAEESDLIFRILNLGAKILFKPSLIVYHPYPKKILDDTSLDKVYKYAIGFGAFCKKNYSYDRNYFAKIYFMSVLRPLCGACLKIFKSRMEAKESLNRVKGRVYGFLQYKKVEERKIWQK